MAKLIINYNGDIIKEYQLNSGSLSIGRDEKNDIHINNPAVSSRHAKILTVLNESFIEDLGSTNGTYINGKRITGHALKDGESIFIGEHELTYTNTESESRNKNLYKSKHDKAADSGTTKKEAADNVYPISTAPQGSAKIQITSGSNAGKELLLDKVINTLGRADTQVAAIIHRPTGFYLLVINAGKDCKMPSVNGAEIDKQILLEDGDCIEVSNVQMRFELL